MRVRLSVCEQDYSQTRAWIWMKCCISTDVETWTKPTNGLTLSPIRIIVRMLEPDCFLRYRLLCNAEFYYVGKIPRICIGRPSLQRSVVLNGLIHREPWEQLCRMYMRSTECPGQYFE